MEDGRMLNAKMELLKLSRFKLQLRALISDSLDLRERERSLTEQLHRSIQKQKVLEEGYAKKLKDLESELGLSIDSQRKLERQVSYLQNDNAMLENKQKELNETIQNLLQSREHFVNAYQESTCEMKRSIEMRDRKIKLLYEKIKSHVLLFESIEKEALSVKKAVDHVRHAVTEKEEVVTGLKRKFASVSEVEKVFMDKINEMENTLKRHKGELQLKDKTISELHMKLEEEQKCSSNGTQIEELQRTLSMKEAVIKNLISEKQVLDSEVKSFGTILEKIQQSFRVMNEGGQSFPSITESQGKCVVFEVVDRVEDSKGNVGKDSDYQPALGGSDESAAYSLLNSNGTSPFTAIPAKIESKVHFEEPACSTTQSPSSEPMPDNEPKSNCTTTACQVESESSTTPAETLDQRG